MPAARHRTTAKIFAVGVWSGTQPNPIVLKRPLAGIVAKQKTPAGVALEPFGLVVPSDHAGGVRGFSSLGTYSTHPLVLRSTPLVGICGPPQPAVMRARRLFCP